MTERKRCVAGVLDEDLRKSVAAEVPLVLSVGDAEALFDLGTVLMDLQSYADAIKVYSRVCEIVPTAAGAHHQLGLAHAKAGNTSDALEAYKRAVKADSNSAVSHNNIGVILSSMGRIGEALQYYLRAQAIDPAYQDAANNVATAHRTTMRYTELMNFFQEAARGMPPYTQAEHVPLTIAGYKRQGDGLGSHAPRLQEYLSESRQIVRFHSLEGGAEDSQNDSDQESKKLDNGVTLVVVEPYRLLQPRVATEYRIYLTLFESDQIPASWVRQLNAEACEVWTTHTWLSQAFRASGLHVPIKLLPIGTDKTNLSPPWHESPQDDVFTFLVLANIQASAVASFLPAASYAPRGGRYCGWHEGCRVE